MHRQILWEHFCHWETLFPNDSSLCQIDMKPTNTAMKGVPWSKLMLCGIVSEPASVSCIDTLQRWAMTWTYKPFLPHKLLLARVFGFRSRKETNIIL